MIRKMAPLEKFDGKLFEKAESAERERQLGSVRSSDAFKYGHYSHM